MDFILSTDKPPLINIINRIINLSTPIINNLLPIYKHLLILLLIF